jgi:hypothetical protein
VPKRAPRRWRPALVLCGAIALAAYALALSFFLDPAVHPEEHPAARPQRQTLGPPANRLDGRQRVVGRFRAHVERTTSRRILEGENRAFRFEPPPEAGVVARRFLQAYLRYEAGPLTSGTRAVLKQLGTRQLSRSLTDAPPRIPSGASPPIERFVRLGPVRRVLSPAGRMFNASGVIRRDGRPVVLNLTLVGTLGNLRVAEIGR